MKKIYLGLLTSLLTSSLFAQSFEEITGTPFDGVSIGSVAFADIDNDNDQDVLITGIDSLDQPIAKLYNNDGTGFFSEVIGTPFNAVGWSSIAFADIDNDNDQDVLITGMESITLLIAKLYKNDGTGSFTEVVGTPFDGVYRSSISFADIDNDNDQDVLITGDSGKFPSIIPISKLYNNDGNGFFTEVTDTSIEAVFNGSIAFADIDDDNDQDVLITGYSNSGFISKLYTNDGNGNFEELIGTPFEGVGYSSIAFADIDNDNDQDVLITGATSIESDWVIRISKLYTNNGNGNFTQVVTPFEPVVVGSVAFADIDNDNDQDVLITGDIDYMPFSQNFAKLYANNGYGSFSVVSGTPFDPVSYSSIAFEDIDNDGDQDVLITGSSNTSPSISKLYRNLTFSTRVVEEHTSFNDVSIFPNPVTNELFISNNSEIIISEVNIYNQLGQNVLHEQWPSNSIDVSMLRPGIYIIEIVVDKSLVRKKLIIE